MIHVDFGLVTKNRQKLSTRKGNIILLEPTLQEAISRAKAQIEEKNPELENKEEVAHAVGVGAVKFYDLKTDRRNGYDFDLEAMVSFEGETGPIRSIRIRTYPIHPSQSQLHTICRCNLQLERPRKLGNHQTSPRLLSCRETCC